MEDHSQKYPMPGGVLARRRGASEQEIMEAIWVAAEMRAGAAFAPSLIAMEAMEPGKSAPEAG